MRGFKRANQQGKLLIQFHSAKSEVFLRGGAHMQWMARILENISVLLDYDSCQHK